MEPLKYRSFNRVLREEFGQKVYRVVVKGGFTCPNRDGRLARGGCTFCNEEGHRPTTMVGERGWPPVTQQLELGIAHLRKRFNSHKFLAYFLDYSATYESADVLRPMYTEALAFPDVVGLVLSTRSDCLADDVLDLLSELNERTYLWVELGLQSANDETLARVRRYHTVENVAQCAWELKRRGIRTGVHAILGLPGEGALDYRRTAEFISEIGFDAVKIHNMYVLKNTVLGRQYLAGDYQPLTMEEYTHHAVDFLERIPPSMIIQRLTAQGPKPLMLAPQWCINKHVALRAITDEIDRRDSWQGKFFKSGRRLPNASQ